MEKIVQSTKELISACFYIFTFFVCHINIKFCLPFRSNYILILKKTKDK